MKKTHLEQIKVYFSVKYDDHAQAFKKFLHSPRDVQEAVFLKVRKYFRNEHLANDPEYPCWHDVDMMIDYITDNCMSGTLSSGGHNVMFMLGADQFYRELEHERNSKMTYENFDKLLENMIVEEVKVGRTKGAEYTQGDRLDNFKRTAIELGISPKKVLWVLLKKHLDSIASYIKTDQVLSEPIEGRIMDARVYLSLLRGLIEEEKGNIQK